MPASTTRRYHVNGPAVLQATVGTLAAGVYPLVTVGVAEDGCDLEFKTYYKEVKADGGGGGESAPVNFVYLNATVTIRTTLVPYAGVYMNRIREAAAANLGGTEGVSVQSGALFQIPGSPYTAGQNLLQIRIATLDEDGDWNFDACFVTKAGDHKLGPRENKPQLEFLAINWFNPSTAATIENAVLYTRT